jgi:hypothetical protein
MPPGECWNLLSDYPGACRLRPGDVQGIAEALARQLRHHGIADQGPFAWDGTPFERRSQAGQLADLLDSLMDN